MAKPTSLPRWATDVGAMITEPTEGKKDSGWAPLEKPPAQYFNWWQKVVYLWAVYLDGLTNEALTWAAKHTFQAGLASDVAPVGLADVVRKAELDAEASARAIADADAETALNNAASAEAFAREAGDSSTLASAQAYTNGKFPAPAWTTMASGAANWTAAAGDIAPAYWRDATGTVHLRGKLTCNTGYSSNQIDMAATGALPVGCRPLAPRIMSGILIPAAGDMKTLEVVVFDSGRISASTGPTRTWVVGETIYLDGLTFVAEQ